MLMHCRRNTAVPRAASAKRLGCRLFLGATTLAAGQGGIGRVARLTARALIDAGYNLSLASYLDKDSMSVGPVGSAPAGASKLLFAGLCHRAAIRTRFCFY